MFRILLVEDEKRIREGLKILLNWEEFGFTISGECDNGIDALAKMRSGQYDVILSDIRLPGMNGLEVLTSLRLEGIAFRAIMISGYADFEYARSSIDLGVKNYLLKPVDKNLLAQTLEKIRLELDVERGISHTNGHSLESLIMKHVEQNYMQHISIRRISDDLGYNPCYIGRYFSQKTGMTITEYLYSVRIRKTCALLVEGHLKIHDIAFEVGFRDMNRFYHEFKRIHGVTPKEYLSRLAN